MYKITVLNKYYIGYHIIYGVKIIHGEIKMIYGTIFDYFQYFLTYWSFLCDFTLGMAIWFQVSRVYSWEQPLVWLDWHLLWGWSVNHWLEPILQKMWSTDRLDIQNPDSICKKLKLHVRKLACHPPSTFDYPVVLPNAFWRSFTSISFFPEIFTVSSKTPQLSSWWISFHQWIIFTN